MSDRTPKVFGYARASAKKQVESPETQKDMQKKYAVFNNLGAVTFFVDAATSGKISWPDRDAGKEAPQGRPRHPEQAGPGLPEAVRLRGRP